MERLNQFRLFDSHFHIIDDRFPLVPNQGYLPPTFTTDDYLKRTSDYHISGGAVVSGSFQGFDQSYLIEALKVLGPGFVGVTQLPSTVTDKELVDLNDAGVRAVRFNLKRGGSESVDKLDFFARRVFDVVGWHTELYVDSVHLPDLHTTLVSLPKVSIDHLGLSKAGFADVLALVEKGIYIKATGFGRVDFDVADAVQEIMKVNPGALVFGTDLPSTRAAKPYADEDFLRIIDALGEEKAAKVFYDNARQFYQPDF